MQEIEDLAKQFAQIAERVKSGEPLFVGIPEPVVEAKVKKKRVLTEEQRAKASAAQRTYAKANPEKMRAHRKAYREANREKVLASKKAYREANKEKILAYRLANQEHNRQKSARWRAENPLRALEHNVVCHLVSGLPPEIRKSARRTIPIALVEANKLQILIKREIKQNEKCRTDA